VNSPPDSIQAIAGDEKLVFDFFTQFSRFECALKRAGFVKGSRPDGGYAKPDWETFANELDGTLAAVTDIDFIAAKSFLLRKPPDKQMFVPPHGMRWEMNSKKAGESDAQYLLRLVGDVRNNLFHGAKYPSAEGGYVDGKALRNSNRLKACLTVLDKCRSLNASVKSHFAEAA
jgi:hypothetical protein